MQSFTIHIIAPYPAMVPIIEECLSEFTDIQIGYSVGDLENGVSIAKEEERNGTNFIISRGGTAKLIKQHVNIPVIDMQLSGYDLLRSLTLASNIQDKTAVVGFSNITTNATSIIDVLDLPINVYTIHDSSEVAPLLLELKEVGYQQILGDVITIDTSEAYQLKGMLLQSGKESIIQSIKDAIFLYNHLNRNNKINDVLKQFILKDHPNILIIDEQHEIVEEHLTDFPSNPFSQEQLYMLNTQLHANDYTQQVLTRENEQIVVTGYRYTALGRTYKLYTFSQNETKRKVEKGIHYHHVVREPLAATSEAMATIIKSLTSLYKHNEAVFLYGEKGTGKNFIVEQIHQQLADGLLVTVGGAEINKSQWDELIDPAIRTILFKHVNEMIQNATFQQFLEDCQAHRIRVFVLAEEMVDLEKLEELNLNLLQMPTIYDRKEDIHELILYFLADYHQAYGTKAIKVTDAALEKIKNQRYKNNMDSLKTFIKQLALNEEDYLIHKETVENVQANHPKETPLPVQGTLKEIETEIVKRVLLEENNNQTKAAKRLGINRSTLWRKLKG